MAIFVQPDRFLPLNSSALKPLDVTVEQTDPVSLAIHFTQGEGGHGGQAVQATAHFAESSDRLLAVVPLEPRQASQLFQQAAALVPGFERKVGSELRNGSQITANHGDSQISLRYTRADDLATIGLRNAVGAKKQGAIIIGAHKGKPEVLVDYLQKSLRHFTS